MNKVLLFIDCVLLIIVASIGIFYYQKDHIKVSSVPVNPRIADTYKKRIALTFDDGPHSVYTTELLDGLAKRNVRASFFILGKRIAGNEQLILRMYEEHHVIGNHTFDHVQLNKLSMEESMDQIKKTNEALMDITGEIPLYIRPPYGEWSKELEKNVNMLAVMWDIDTMDWSSQDTKQIIPIVMEELEDDTIILFHDSYASTVDAVLQIVDELLGKNYEFVTVNELIME